MIKNKFLIIISVFLIIVVLLSLLVFKTELRSYFSPIVKTLVKKTILSDELKLKLDKLEKHEVSNHFKKHYNELDFPQTQFLKLSYKEFSIQEKINSELVLKNYDGKYHSKSNFFLENFDEDIIIASESGPFFFLNSKIIKSDIDYNIENISSNLDSEKIQILDILKVDQELVVSYSRYISENCFSFNIAKAKFNKDFLKFNKFFETSECQPKYFAGRLFEYFHEKEKGLLVSIDVWGVTLENKEKRNSANYLAQDDESPFGKILFVNYRGEYDVFSKGHRTPQGLFVTKDNFILSTEHGPRGGDEINLIKYKGNYGWPTSSYGELYPNQEPKNNEFFYKKSHSDNNFIEPLFVFFQSIGISQLIDVPKNFSDFWINNFLITSLNGSSLYRVKFDKNFTKLQYFEKIFIGKRIRDIIYLKNFKTFVISLDEKKGYLGFIGVE